VNARHLNRGGLLALVRRRASRLGTGGLALAVLVLAASSSADAVAAHNASHARSPKSVARSTLLTQSGALRSAVQRTLGRSWGGGDKASRGGGPAGWGGRSLAGSTGNQLGHSVAISGNFAVASAPGTNNDTGLANFWQHEGGGWQQVLTLPDPRRAEDDYFAWAVAVSSTKSGTYAAIGGNDSNGKPDRVYIYTGSGTSWDLQATIDDPGTSYKDMYGDNLAISPSTLVVGASCGEANSGAAYIYHHDGSRWVLQDSILDPRATADDFFGQAVAVSGNRVMIGAVGWTYVYTYTSGQGWTRTATIANPGPSGDSFGQSVALSGTGTTAVITAPGVPPVGAAYVYDLSGTTWARQQELTEPGGGEFGWAAAMSGSELLVGMPIGGQPNCGTAFAYKLSGTKFTLQEPVADPDASCATGDEFGYSVALSGTYGVYGAPGANNGQGANYELPLP
jgi:hypothetical protein